MENNQLIPFERNRYYVGKMLTSMDFKAEQNYFNNKRRFINNIIFGSGIVCGMSIFNLDDLSIMVESGVAVDGYGREVVIDKAVVKKMSAINGFEELETNKVSLCVKYMENPVSPVYAVNKLDNAESYEYNRISESYDLFLMDTESMKPVYEIEQEFLTKLLIAETKNYKAEISIPATVCKGRPVKLILKLKKKSDIEKTFHLKCVFQMPAFKSVDKGHELIIDTGKVNLSNEEEMLYEYKLMAQGIATANSDIVLKPESFEAYEDDKAIEPRENIKITLGIASVLPEELVAREAGKYNLEMKNMAGEKDYIKLADFRLIRTGSAYLIDSIDIDNVRTYIQTPSQAGMRMEYMRYFEGDMIFKNEIKNHNELPNGQVTLAKNDIKPIIATGVLEIPFADRMKKGDIRYSGEIMHGLGQGDVYVEVGCEYMEENNIKGIKTRSTVYGNPDLFKDKSLISSIEKAVKVLNEKGSFIVAVKLLKETEFVMLTLRWTAVKACSNEDLNMIEYYEGKSISAKKPTVMLGLQESYFFDVKFNNMKPCSITYELPEQGSGTITMDGTYTSPAKEGVYEIRISCTDMPIICTYAYAVVRKKPVPNNKTDG